MAHVTGKLDLIYKYTKTATYILQKLISIYNHNKSLIKQLNVY